MAPVTPTSPCSHYPSPCPPSFFSLGVCTSSHLISKPQPYHRSLFRPDDHTKDFPGTPISHCPSSLISNSLAAIAYSSLFNQLERPQQYGMGGNFEISLNDIKPGADGVCNIARASSVSLATMRSLGYGDLEGEAFNAATSLPSPTKPCDMQSGYGGHVYDPARAKTVYHGYGREHIRQSSAYRLPSRLGIDETTLRELEGPLFSSTNSDTHTKYIKPTSVNHSHINNNMNPPIWQSFNGDDYDIKPHIHHHLHFINPTFPSTTNAPSRAPCSTSSYSPTIRIVHIKAPKVVKTDPASFRSVVQKLTGKSCKKSKKQLKRSKEETGGAYSCSSPQALPSLSGKACTMDGFEGRFDEGRMDKEVGGRELEQHVSITSLQETNPNQSFEASTNSMHSASTQVCPTRGSLLWQFSQEPLSLDMSKLAHGSSTSTDSRPQLSLSPVSSSVTSLNGSGGDDGSALSSPTESSDRSGIDSGEPKFTELDIICGLFSAVPSHVLELPTPLTASTVEETTKVAQNPAFWRYPQLMS
ncbi:hypothetical protein L7F22_015047 [Adiantum nelumboides]|nr:hypothetical protein [Adiantum nelumboides]